MICYARPVSLFRLCPPANLTGGPPGSILKERLRFILAIILICQMIFFIPEYIGNVPTKHLARSYNYLQGFSDG